jgi:hypothetical protein
VPTGGKVSSAGKVSSDTLAPFALVPTGDKEQWGDRTSPAVRPLHLQPFLYVLSFLYSPAQLWLEQEIL